MNSACQLVVQADAMTSNSHHSPATAAGLQQHIRHWHYRLLVRSNARRGPAGIIHFSAYWSDRI